MTTGRRQGVLSRMQNVAKPGFMRVLSDAHQLDIGMKAFYLDVSESFYSNITTIAAYLRRQKSFMSQERLQCAVVCYTQWLNAIKVPTWLDKHRLAVAAYVVKNPDCRPDES